MTFKELMKMRYPEKADERDFPEWGCPGTFFDDPPTAGLKCPEYPPDNDTDCVKCWNREVPEETVNQIKKELGIVSPSEPFKNVKGIDEMHEVPCDLQFVTAKKPERGIRYQERGRVRKDVRDLYMRVIKNPNIRYYRCYTDDYSYGWDPCEDDYIQEAGEYWFKNPGFESETLLSPSKLKDTVGEGVAKDFLNGIYGSKAMFNTDAVIINHGDKEIHIKAPEYQVPDYSDATITIHGEKVKRGLRAGLGLNEKDLPPTVADVAIAEMEADKPPVRTDNYIPDYIGPHILDSGNRRQFETGAVRDICEGKGRCDLLPLDVVSHALNDPTFAYIYLFIDSGERNHLYDALSSCGIFHDYYTLMLEVAKHFEEGCKKYGDNNWQKGIPTHCYIDSAVRHYLKYLRGDKDEPHDRAFCWNILCCIWTCIHKPELNDYAKKEDTCNE